MNINKVTSALNLLELVVKECSFKRYEFSAFTSMELDLNLEKSVKGIEGTNQYAVDLSVQVTNQAKEFEAVVVLHSVFSLPEDAPYSSEERDKLLQRNTTAMLMPFIRSQLCLITSQPGMMPITIPPVDINRLIDMVENEEGKPKESE